jgi:DNA/RNA endonuclease YhcR with UshA esterase domain
MFKHFRTARVALVASALLLCSGLNASQPGDAPAPAGSTSAPSTQPASRPADILAATEGAAIRAQMGKSATVGGTVFRAQLSSTGRVFRIEFKDARESGFNSVIFERSYKLFRDKFGEDLSAAFTGKTVEITGVIEEYRGNPQIILNRPDQIRILP